ncbi:MAG: hypothetical protein WC307_02230 [Candidatus Nanoarchaeia archaeon]|jgi:phosphomannomutase
MAYDVRGRGITTHQSFILGRALGTKLKGTCFIGWDCRESSPALGEHLIEGLRSSGINVTKGGFMPGPVCYYKILNTYDFGVFITASHLPKEYNGFKIIMRDGSGIAPEELKEVRELFNNYNFNKVESASVKQDITATNDYARFLEKEFGRIEVKCVIDCLNGSTGALTNSVFNKLLDATVLNNEPKSDFGGKSPEPSEKNLHELQERVLSENASFGAGLDGDGDRSVFVDDKGRVIDGNMMTMLFTKEILKKKKGVIVAPPSVSSVIETKIVKPMGGTMVWCKVGHTFIEKELVKQKGLFGGEESSHFYWNEYYPFSDGALSVLMMARIIKETGKKLSELIDELPKVVVIKEEVEFSTHQEKEEVAAKIINRLMQENTQALTMDGIKFTRPDEVSVLLRPSQTRHTVKVFIEAEERLIADKALEEYVQLIQSYKQLHNHSDTIIQNQASPDQTLIEHN